MDLRNYPLWTALITPLLEDGRVDYTSIEVLVRRQEMAGNGIVLLGSTGEALNLDLNEKKSIVNYVCKLRPAVPIMVGVGGFNLRATLSWIQFLEGQNVHAYMLTTPLYSKPEDKGQYKWFKSLMDFSSRPVILYNVPGRAAKALSLYACEQLADHPNLLGIKEASGSVDDFQAYRAINSDLMVYSGDDVMLPEFGKLGANGLISVASNVWPRAIRRFTQICLEQDSISVDKVVDACNALFVVSNPIPVKALMHHKGLIQTPLLRLPLDHEDMKDMDKVIRHDQVITAWFESLSSVKA